MPPSGRGRGRKANAREPKREPLGILMPLYSIGSGQPDVSGISRCGDAQSRSARRRRYSVEGIAHDHHGIEDRNEGTAPLVHPTPACQ